MPSPYSIKNTEEAVAFVKVLCLKLIQSLKDGNGHFELADLVAVMSDQQVIDALAAAVEDAGDIVKEAKDLGWKESLELGHYIYGAVTEILAALK